MIKQGTFVKVKGEEYEIMRVMQSGQSRIIAQKPSQVDERFTDLYGTGVYSREVSQDEIEEKYRYETYALCEGDQLSVRMAKDGKVLVGTSDCDVAAKHKLERTDKYFYEGWLPEGMVELVTKKHNMEESK